MIKLKLDGLFLSCDQCGNQALLSGSGLPDGWVDVKNEIDHRMAIGATGEPGSSIHFCSQQCYDDYKSTINHV